MAEIAITADLLHRKEDAMKVEVYLNQSIRRDRSFRRAHLACNTHWLGNLQILRKKKDHGQNEELYVVLNGLDDSKIARVSAYIERIIVDTDIQPTPLMQKGAYKVPGADGQITPSFSEAVLGEPDGKVGIQIDALNIRSARKLFEEMKAGRLATVPAS